MKIKRFYIIEHKGNTLDITRDALLMGPLPVLWCNAGMYAIIPGAILEELYENVNVIAVETIWWTQAFELSQEVGRLLCDEGYDQAEDSQE